MTASLDLTIIKWPFSNGSIKLLVLGTDAKNNLFPKARTIHPSLPHPQRLPGTFESGRRVEVLLHTQVSDLRHTPIKECATPCLQNPDGRPQGRDGDAGSRLQGQQEGYLLKIDDNDKKNRKHITDEKIVSAFLDRTLCSRLGIRMLVTHHLLLQEPKVQKSRNETFLICSNKAIVQSSILWLFDLFKAGHVGIVNLCMSLKDVVQRWFVFALSSILQRLALLFLPGVHLFNLFHVYHLFH